MVYFVMAALFESLAHPFAIMFSLPFAVVGIAGFLWLTGTPFNLMAKIGLLVLVGIVVNNGIVLIDHVNNLRRKGMARQQAILEGCRERFRPIIMTASTTVVGLIPLAYGDSSMFDMRHFPMARAVMGGADGVYGPHAYRSAHLLHSLRRLCKLDQTNLVRQ